MKNKCLLVVSWLFQRNKCLCLCLLEPEEQVVNFQSFNVWYLPNWGVATFSLQKVQENAGDNGFFSFFAVLILVFELKFGSPAIPWKDLLTHPGITMKVYGKIISSLYPLTPNLTLTHNGSRLSSPPISRKQKIQSLFFSSSYFRNIRAVHSLAEVSAGDLLIGGKFVKDFVMCQLLWENFNKKTVFESKHQK